jgi:hypothetical protein
MVVDGATLRGYTTKAEKMEEPLKAIHPSRR